MSFQVYADFESSLVEFDGEGNHVHLLVNYPPKVYLSKLVNSLKGVSSRIIRRKFSKDVNMMLWKGVLWSPSYFARSCGGAPLDMVKNYIKTKKHQLEKRSAFHPLPEEKRFSGTHDKVQCGSWNDNLPNSII